MGMIPGPYSYGERSINVRVELDRVHDRQIGVYFKAKIIIEVVASEESIYDIEDWNFFEFPRSSAPRDYKIGEVEDSEEDKESHEGEESDLEDEMIQLWLLARGHKSVDQGHRQAGEQANLTPSMVV